MTPELFDLRYDLKDTRIPFRDRFSVLVHVWEEALKDNIEKSELHLFYDAMVELWRSICHDTGAQKEPSSFEARRRLAVFCLTFSRKLPEGQRFFTYFPRVLKAEGFDHYTNKLLTGPLKTGYGSSLYEFHWEYPINGFGIRKDLIKVVTEENEKIPMLDWCRQNNIIVYCNRCGLDITYEVNKKCPYMIARSKGI